MIDVLGAAQACGLHRASAARPLLVIDTIVRLVRDPVDEEIVDADGVVRANILQGTEVCAGRG